MVIYLCSQIQFNLKDNVPSESWAFSAAEDVDNKIKDKVIRMTKENISLIKNL